VAELYSEEIMVLDERAIRRSGLSVAGVLFLLICLPLAGDDKANVTVGPGRRRAVTVNPTNDWNKYCGSLDLNGFAIGERVLSTASVPKLELLWSRTLNGPIASAPSVARSKVYVGDWGGFEWALDEDSGNVVASVNLGQTNIDHCNPSVLGISSSPAIVGNLLYVAGGDDGFYALNADTLTTVWRRSLGDNSAAGGYYGWCSPALAGGKVLQGIASNCDAPWPRGAIVALNPANGETIGETFFVPEGVVGGGIWTSPAVDVPHRKVFLTTGSSHSFADGDAFSMLRLNLDTLEIEDRWKLPYDPDATWDADWGSSPTLFTDASGRELVGAGQKDGGYYVFERDNIASGPIWVAPVAILGEVPQDGQGTLSTAAFDGTTLYVGGGTPPGTTDITVLGAVSAVSPDDGTILWRHTFDGPVIAPVSFANGVAFAVGGKTVAALDAATGAVLWSYKMKAAGFGGIAIAGGRIYVGDLFGTIYTFGVPDN
jgi:polyvinyl alcohol dehydrogenase (cytochrome)